ncbi:MAG: UDP-N-acetylmuramoyl-L-alanine--D-glutamate ligase [Leptolinea sp.]|jgi:UDP-N-acetylmuramoylalanine--D-glutamate ligase|nr:UDP-N-acetylmuramoyl-L-alanine--D-glutamate ligase [Leptolinea sp.]
MKDWQKERVLIIGAARQGLALSRFLASRGSQVTLNDNRTAEQLTKAVETLSDTSVKFHFGGHPVEILDGITLVCISGGVSPTLPIVQEAIKRCIPVSNDAQIFMDIVPCKTIGITGSAGKTTTTTLVGRIGRAGARPDQKVWVGGNIGTPLISFIDQIKSTDLVILELSSFQLELMTSSPNISAVLNITPNHLDRHGTMEAYKAAKRHILDFQSTEDHAILCRDDAGSSDLIPDVRSRLSTFGWNHPIDRHPGTFIMGSDLAYFDGREDHPLIKREDISLRGDHNVLNVLAACAIAAAAGFDAQAMLEGIHGFAGVDHRLEYVGTINGAAWYNDSIATAPERTMAAIRSFTEPLVLMIGGRDKKLPWEDLALLIKERVDHVIVFGEAAPKILDALQKVQTTPESFSIDRAAGLGEAVHLAFERAEADDVVLLSPGGTSYDEFEDFEERGECFRNLVRNLQ